MNRRGKQSEPSNADPAAAKWTGATRSYDLVKEFAIALAVVSLLTVALAVLFSSPNDAPVTLATWARTNPQDFVVTAVSELAGTSGTAGYGPPYNSASEGPKLGPIAVAKIAGVHTRVDTAEDLVLKPLDTLAADVPDLTSAIAAWRAASSTDRQTWTDAYTAAAGQASFDQGTTAQVPSGDYGPVAPMMTALLTMARSGALDGALLNTGGFYNNDYTKPLLFLGDGSYLPDLAVSRHLDGDQWGMMNEVGNYPGQPWLWLYTFWYQVPPFKTSGNADALVGALMGVLTVGFVLLPFIPGVRSLPKKLGVYRYIWRDHYRSQR